MGVVSSIGDALGSVGQAVVDVVKVAAPAVSNYFVPGSGGLVNNLVNGGGSSQQPQGFAPQQQQQYGMLQQQGPMDWTTWAQNMLSPQGVGNLANSAYGIWQGNQLQNQAMRANPWQQSGGYALAGQQLQNLMRDPGQVAAGDPGYQLAMQGAQRAMAGYGQNSGAMAVAGANASNDWLNKRMQSLGNLAGANYNPVANVQQAHAGMQMQQQGLGYLNKPLVQSGGQQQTSGGLGSMLNTDWFNSAPTNNTTYQGNAAMPGFYDPWGAYGTATPGINPTSGYSPLSSPAATMSYTGGNIGMPTSSFLNTFGF